MCAKSIGSALVLTWLAFHLGGQTPASKVLDRLESSVARPLPALPQPEVRRPDSVWVPDRHVPRPGGKRALVPGHWERRVSDREVYAPPLAVCARPGGDCSLVPAGVRPPADVRRDP